MTEITRRFQFCAGHRVMGHENKCANLHGHNYVLYVHAAAELDNIGRVLDFSVVKELIGRWIDANWDHGFILCERDLAGREALESFRTTAERGQKLFLLHNNPTAENLAMYLLQDICPGLLPTHVQATKVELWETENCCATVELEAK